MDVIGHGLSPAQRLGSAGPAQRLLGVLDGGQHLNGGHQQPYGDEESGKAHAQEARSEILPHHDIYQPHGAEQHRGKRRHHVMPAEECHAERAAGERGARGRSMAARGAQEEQKHQRRPDRAHENLRPVGVPHKSGEREDRSAEDRREVPSLQIAAQCIAEHRAQPMNQHPIPVQRGDGNVPVAQGHREKNPVQRIGDAGLHLPDQRMAAPLVRIPKGKPSRVKFARFEIQPGAHDVGEIRTLQEGPVRRDGELPVEARRQQQEHEKRARGAPAGSHDTNPVSPVPAWAKTGGSRREQSRTSTRKS